MSTGGALVLAAGGRVGVGGVGVGDEAKPFGYAPNGFQEPVEANGLVEVVDNGLEVIRFGGILGRRRDHNHDRMRLWQRFQKLDAGHIGHFHV